MHRNDVTELHASPRCTHPNDVTKMRLSKDPASPMSRI